LGDLFGQLEFDWVDPAQIQVLSASPHLLPNSTSAQMPNRAFFCDARIQPSGDLFGKIESTSSVSLGCLFAG